MGVKVKRNKRSGKLAFRLIWSELPGGRSWETTDLLDTPENRRTLDAWAAEMNAQMRLGRFSYLAHFPHGSKSAALAGRSSRKPATLGDYYAQWVLDKKPPVVRKSAARDYRQHWQAYICGALGASPIQTIGVADLRALRSKLVERGLKMKTAKNVISGTLAAILRDAQVDGVIARSPLKDVPPGFWPRTVIPGPEPFEAAERVRVVEWFYRNSRLFWPFVAFELYQSLRPSEAIALTWDKVDIEHELVHVTASRNLGETNATKVPQARRVARLKPHIAEMLRSIKPLHAGNGVYVFTNTLGRPIDMQTFKKLWGRAMRSITPALRPRGFYACKDTAISLDIMDGCNIKRVAQEAGISLVTLERHYGMWIETAAVSETQSETEKAEARKVANSKTFPWWSQRESNPFHLASEQSPKTVVSQDSCDDFTQPDAASLPAVSSDKNTSFKGRK